MIYFIISSLEHNAGRWLILLRTLLHGALIVCWTSLFSFLSLHAQSGNDTLINFNTLLGGARSITMPQDQQLPEGITLHPEGLLLGVDSLLLSRESPLNFKVEAGNGDVYEIQAQVRRKNGRTFWIIQTDRIEMATGWRKDGKIWVVVAVSVIVFLAILAFLLYLERRLSRLEKDSSV